MRDTRRWLLAHAHALAWNGAAFLFLGASFFELVARSEPRLGVATLLLGSGALAGVIGNAHRIEVLKVFGLEARTRQVVQEAEGVIASLREVAAEFGAVMVETLSSANGFADRNTYRVRDAQRRRVLDALRGLGVPADRITAVGLADREQVIAAYAHGVLKSLHRAAKGTPLQETVEAPILAWNEGGDTPSTAALRAVARSLPAPVPAAEALLADMEHYSANGEHRRPDVWAARGDW
ncbi:hypothetical protein [Falsiroseomonas sp.]|uniref:hypothetical protein n=1 Tax=Falsiroseomonas sp. TaxID=2870721 RepID=UPI0035675A4C